MSIRASEQGKTDWLTLARTGEGPAYRRIAAAIERAVERGELQPGDRLPPQRAMAEQLGVDFTTITKGYALARERGLVEGEVGRGTFIRRQAEEIDSRIDLGMNLPPPPMGVSLGALLAETTQRILAKADASTLMAYHPGAGSAAQRAAGQAWLETTLGSVEPDRILVCTGAQTALAALLSPSLRRGDHLVVEPLTYPGVLAAAMRAGMRVSTASVDGEGFEPYALEKTLRDQGAGMVYLCPTFQNPVATSMGAQRRREIAAVLRRADAMLIEDDAYGRLPATPELAISALIPERSWHVATVSKALTPGLRAAFLVAPDEAAASGAQEVLRALSLMASPLTMAILTRWIREGAAETLLKGVRAETAARRKLAAEIFPTAVGGTESLHVWIDLPEGRDERDVRLEAHENGLALVTSSAFCLGAPLRAGVRISLGGAARREGLRGALELASRVIQNGGQRDWKLV